MVLYSVQKTFSRFVEKDAAVIGQGDVDIPAVLEQGGNQRRGNIREPAGLGLEAVGHPAHAFRQVGDFRRDDEHAGFFSAAQEFHVPSPVQLLLFQAQVINPGVYLMKESARGVTRAVNPNRPAARQGREHS